MNTIRLHALFVVLAFFLLPVWAQTPVVSPDVPNESFLGEQFCFDLDFSNSGDPGYGPYLRIELAAELSLDSADIFGVGTLIPVGVFPPAPGNELDDPVIDQPVIGTPGSSLYILKYPVGSMVDGGPDLPARLCATIDPDALVGVPLDIIFTPVYQFGDTPTGGNGPIIGTPINETVTPTVMRLTKSNTAPEDERTPGESWPYSYVLTVDIADQATISPLVITDELPDEFQFNGTLTIDGGDSCTATTLPSTTSPGGSLEVTCTGNTVGTLDADDVVVTFEGHIVDILDPAQCTDEVLPNTAFANGSYLPSSGPALVLPEEEDDSDVIARHLAVQKYVSPGEAAPGASLVYTLDFQVTDFADAENLVVTDVLPDGIDFIAHSSLLINGTAVAITPTVTGNPDATTTIVYDIGAVAGQLVAGTAVQLRYDGQVRNDYLGSTEPVLASDALTNHVDADYDLTQGASACRDNSAATVHIEPVAVDKTIVDLQPEYLPGDEITFRLTLEVPAGSTRDIQFEDFLPLPVIRVADLDLSFPGPSLDYGPDDTAGLTPVSISISGDHNALYIDWPDVSSPTPQTIQVDLTATITDEPFADGLYLTNILRANTHNTAGDASTGKGPAHFWVGAPDVFITKGVAGTDGIGNIDPDPSDLPVDGDLEGADAHDTITFIITAENQGGAPAYDVTITDNFPGGLDNCNLISVEDGTGLPLGYTGSLSTGLVLDDPLPSSSGVPTPPFGAETALLTVTCQVAADIAPDTVLVNTVKLSFSSQSGSTDFPERSDDATVRTANIDQEKFYVSSSEPATPDNANPPLATIGEIVRYRLAVRIPEGEITAFSLRDNLPSGLTFLDDGTTTAAFISANGSGLASSTLAVPNLTGTAVDPGTLASADLSFVLPGSAISGGAFGNGTDPVFSFGTVSNSNMDNSGAWLAVEFNAVVNNTGAGNNRIGATRSNSFATFSGTTNLDGDSNTVDIRIAEPVLNLYKVAAAGVGQAGDLITFDLTLEADAGSNNSPAYEVKLSDELPAGLINLSNLNITPSAGCIGVTDNTAGDHLQLSIDVMEPGCKIDISFEAELELSVAPGTIIYNEASTKWTSLPGTHGTAPNPTGSTTPDVPGSDEGERDGSNTGMNDYIESSIAPVTIHSVVASKVVSATSETATDSDEHRPAIEDLAIGEQATFDITVTVPHGTAPQVVIIDTVPFTNGIMRVDGANIVSVGNNLTHTLPGTPVISDSQLGDGIDDTVEFDFGQIVNSGSGALSIDDQIVVQVHATLVDDTANTNGDELTNNVLVRFGPGLNASAHAGVDVVEPLLVIDKAGDITGGDAGDIVTYTVTIKHTTASTADAHDLVFDDALPPKLDLVAGSLQVISGPNFDVNNSSGNTISLGWLGLERGDEIVLEYQAQLTVDVHPQEELVNTARLAWDSIAGANDDERSYQAEDDHTVTVTQPGMDKIIFATSEPSTGSGQYGPEEDLTIGEIVTYRFTATFPEGTSNSVVITDQLPTGTSTLAVVSSSVISVGANLSGASLPAVGTAGVHSDSNADGHDDRVRWQLDTVINSIDGVVDDKDRITFEVVAVVVDVSANQGGITNQLNRATLETDSSDPITGSVGVDLVAPDLELSKSIADPVDGRVEAGETVTVRLAIDHTSDSSADAFHLEITDTLPVGLNWAGDASVAGSCSGVIVDSSALPNVIFSFPELGLADAGCDITYEVEVDQSVEAGSELINSAELEYYTLPDKNADHNRRRDSADNASVTIKGPGLTKTAQSSGMMAVTFGGGIKALPNVAIGETVTYQLVIEFPEGVTTDAVLVDALPASATDGYLEAIGASVISIGGNLSTTLPGTPIFSDVNADGIDDTITFDFGDVTNTIDGVSDANDRLTVEIVALVVDHPANADGLTLVNEAELTYGVDGSMIDDAEVYVIEPDVSLNKSMSLRNNSGLVRIELTLENSGNAAAWNLEVEDIFEEGTWDLSGFSAVSVPAGFTLDLQANTPAPGQQTVTFASDPNATAPAGSLQPGASVTAVFDIPLLELPPNPNPVQNTADLVGGDSLPPKNGSPRDEARDLPPVSDDDLLALPDLTLIKTAALHDDVDNSGTVSPGDVLRYTLTLDNIGPGEATNLVIDDVPDANSTLVVGSVTTSAGTVVIGNNPGDGSIQVTLSSLAAGDTVIIEYDTEINSPLPAGVTEVVNQAVVGSDELPDVPSDDPDEPGPDDPTVVPVDAAPDLSITKSDGGASPVPGGVLSYTLSYANNGNQDATGVEITETVPDHTSFDAAASDAGWTCANTTPGSLCTLVVGNLAAGASGSVVFAVELDSPLPAGVSTIFNEVLIEDDGNNGPDPTPNDNEDDETTPVNAAPDLMLTKSDGGVTATPGGSVVYTLSYENIGNQDATGVEITETVPAHTSFDAAASTAGWVCTPDGSAGSQCILSIGNVGVGDTGSVSFAIRVDDPVDAGVTSILNVARIDDDGNNGPDPTPGNNEDDETTPLDVNPALALDKVLSNAPNPVELGSVLTYTITAQNVGNVTLTNVVISDPLITPTGGTSPCASVAPGDTCTLIGTYIVTQGDVDAGQVVNTATGSSDQTPDEDDTVTTPVVQDPAIALDKTVTSVGAPYGEGDTITYELVATNTGTVTLHNVMISDPGATITGCVPAQPASLIPGATLTCQAEHVVTQADLNAGTPYTNTATVIGEDGDGNPVSDDDSADAPLDRDAGIVLDKSITSAGAPYGEGDTITYELVATNTGTVTLNNVEISDPDATITSCVPVQPASLAAGESLTCQAEYTVTQADLDAGSPFVNTAHVDGTDPDGNPVEDDDSADAPLDRNGELSLAKTVTSAGAPYGEGDTITYELVATNTGTVTLDNVEISDPDATITSCTPAQPLTLAPGESLTCQAEHVVTQADLDAGSPFVNTARAEGTDPDGDPVDDDDSADAPLDRDGELSLAKTITSAGAPYGEGDTITYELVATNTGTVTLDNVEISDPDAVITSCMPAQPLTLAPGESLTCQAEHVVTQADLDAGSPFTNTATADGRDPDGDPVSDDDSEDAPLDVDGGLVLIKTITSTGAPYAQGELITYELVATNTGNVTLDNVEISDPDAIITSCTPAQPVSLAPGESLTCQAEHTVTKADLDAGSPFTNTATARGEDPGGDPITDDDTEDAPLRDEPEITLVKSVVSSGPYKPGDTVTYAFEVTNTGGYTLNNVEVDDPMLGGIIPCTPSTLQPGEVATCGPVDYVLTPADVAGRTLENIASASGEDDDGGVVDDDDSVVIVIAPPIPVPTAPGWMLLLLAGLIATVGLRLARTGQP